MQMSDARRISEAVGSWLHFEFACYRGGLLSESALKAAVGQVLSSFPIESRGTRAQAEVRHSALGGLKRLDYALCIRSDNEVVDSVQVAVETKWADSLHSSSANIGKDLVRLLLVKRANPAARCIFLLAGSAKCLREVLSKPPFTKSSKTNMGLRQSLTVVRVTLDRGKPEHVAGFSEGIAEWRGRTRVPSSFLAKSYGLHPKQTEIGPVRFQAICWEIANVSPTDIADVDQWPN